MGGAQPRPALRLRLPYRPPVPLQAARPTHLHQLLLHARGQQGVQHVPVGALGLQRVGQHHLEQQAHVGAALGQLPAGGGRAMGWRAGEGGAGGARRAPAACPLPPKQPTAPTHLTEVSPSLTSFVTYISASRPLALLCCSSA